jgi:hypothetical protein
MTITMTKVILAVGVLICGVSGQSNENTGLRSGEILALKDKMAKMEAKYAELLTCVSVEEGKTVVLKEGCDLVVNKGNHKLEGQLHILGTHIIDGGNLHVHNGLGSPDCSSTMETKCNGSGNLIIGHSPESSELFHRNLSGSHNIIAGVGHSVYSYGSIVSGSDHTLLGAHSSAISGISNTAVSEGSAVLGGSNNVAGSVLGKVHDSNKSDHTYATVTGGTNNVASGGRSSVSGGNSNEAAGKYSWAAGGDSNKAKEESSSACGGEYNKALSERSLILGGNGATVSKVNKPKIGDV